MNQVIIDGIYLLCIAVSLTFFLFLIFAIIYDIRRPRPANHLSLKKPHVSIVVINQSSHQRTMRLLTSIAASSYRHYDIVLLDNLSRHADVAKFRKELRSFASDAKLYMRRKVAPLDIAINDAYKRSKRGEIILVLNSIDVISPGTLSEIARQFNTVPGVSALRLNDMTAGDEGLVSVLSSVDDAFKRLAYTLRLRRKYDRTAILTPGHAFRCNILTNRAKMTRKTLAFCTPARRVVEPDPLFGRRLRVRGQKALVAGVLVTVCGYVLTMVAIQQGEVEPLIVCWLTMAACVMSLVFVDSTLSVRRKMDVAIFLGLLPLLSTAALFVTRNPK